MTTQILTLTAFIVALGICMRARAIGEKLNVMAIPDSRRKRHLLPTPQVGGIAILSGLMIWVLGSLLVSGPFADPLLLALLLTGGGLGLVGFVDDQIEISPTSRTLLLLTFTAIAFALDSQLIAPTLNWYSFAPTQIPAWLYVPLMMVTAVGLVNSVNMADGQNGLVGGMFAIWSGCLIMVSSGVVAEVATILLGLSLIFLMFNIQGRIFLGDSGSYGVTFLIGLLTTRAHAEHAVALETIIVWFFIPVMDCLRLMITRPLQRRSIVLSGRDHFHHRLCDLLGPRRSAMVYVAGVGIPSILATLYPRFVLLILCGLCAFYFSFARLGERVDEEQAAGDPGLAENPDAARVVALKLARRDDRS